jgi:hypothetical protein
MQRVFCGFNQRVKGSIERSIVCVLRRAVLWDGGRGSASGDSLSKFAAHRRWIAEEFQQQPQELGRKGTWR